MTILHMETEAVRATANLFSRISDDIRNQFQVITAEVQSVEWISPSREQFVSEILRLNEIVHQHLESGNELAERVRREVKEWETAASALNTDSGYINLTIPSAVSLTGVVDRRPPIREWLGDHTPLAFIPGFTPPAGGDIETIDSRLAQKFGRDVNIVDGNERWSEHEAAAIDRAVQHLPDCLAKDSLIRNFYRESSSGNNVLAFWVPPNYSGNEHGVHEANSITFMSPFQIPRQGSLEAGERVETVIFHELVHSAQYQSNGQFTNLTQSYLNQFGWSVNEDWSWNYSGSMKNFPGDSDTFLIRVGYPVQFRTGLEDMAEAVTYFRYEPETLLRDSPERYEWVKTYIFNGEEYR